MLDRHKRHSKLLQLIAGRSALNQEQLVAQMRKAGFPVTQSSISRDLRELGVVKVAGKYVAPEQLKGQDGSKGLQRFIQGVDLAGPHLLVVQTAPGSANLVAEFLDKQKIAGVSGTIAGDNTIFIATKNNAAQERAINQIKQIR